MVLTPDWGLKVSTEESRRRQGIRVGERRSASGRGAGRVFLSERESENTQHEEEWGLAR